VARQYQQHKQALASSGDSQERRLAARLWPVANGGKLHLHMKWRLTANDLPYWVEEPIEHHVLWLGAKTFLHARLADLPAHVPVVSAAVASEGADELRPKPVAGRRLRYTPDSDE